MKEVIAICAIYIVGVFGICQEAFSINSSIETIEVVEVSATNETFSRY